MTKNIRFLPYEELQVRVVDSQHYIVETPWLAFQIKVDSNDQKVHKTLQAYAAQDLGNTNIEVLSNFLKELKSPFHYIVPSKNHEAQDVPVDRFPNEAINWSKQEMRQHLGLDPAKILIDWQWDTEAVLEFTELKPSKLYDPSSILSVVRRFHLLDCVDQDQTKELYDYCKTTPIQDSANLNQYLATIVYQNYYVTAACQQALAPAVKMAGRAEQDVLDFMKDEEGHDLLLNRAVTNLHPEMASLYLATSTKNIMNLLKKSGELNFLAYCLAVDFFEKTSHDEIDPLAALLLHYKKVIAADCLQKHKNINDDGAHEGVSLKFLKHLKAVPKDYAVLAIRFSEILSDEMTSVTAELLERFRSLEVR